MAITILSHSCLGMCTSLQIFKALEFWSEIGWCLVIFDHFLGFQGLRIIPQPALSIMGSGGSGHGPHGHRCLERRTVGSKPVPRSLEGAPSWGPNQFHRQFRRRTRKRLVEILVATAMRWITSPAFLRREPIAQFVSILGFCRPETCWAASSIGNVANQCKANHQPSPVGVYFIIRIKLLGIPVYPIWDD